MRSAEICSTVITLTKTTVSIMEIHSTPFILLTEFLKYIDWLK